jgi:hypothetical protein
VDSQPRPHCFRLSAATRRGNPSTVISTQHAIASVRVRAWFVRIDTAMIAPTIAVQPNTIASISASRAGGHGVASRSGQSTT